MSWQKILSEGFSSSQQLLHFLGLPPTFGSIAAETSFKVRVPRGFAARMKPGDPRDPLLLQVLAVQEELLEDPAYTQDPLEEKQAGVRQGLLHKYQGRVLITLAGACAINCRYCFRRHFPYQENNPGRKGLENILDYIRNDPSIFEIILSGGDPLLAANSVLAWFISELEKISHVRTLRFHTRIPIVLPERFEPELLKILTQTSLRKVMVIHCNHPQEINHEVRKVCQNLRESGVHLLNQSVLLKGINDCHFILRELSEQLFNCGILPYYLHVLDKVSGATHFDLSSDKIRVIYKKLQSLLPGYLLPRLAREEPGKKSKTLLI